LLTRTLPGLLKRNAGGVAQNRHTHLRPRKKHKMKKNFEIYPALFLITSRCKVKETVRFQQMMKGITYRETNEERTPFHPRIDYNHCLLNASHTQVMLTLGKRQRPVTQIELPDELLANLKAKTVVGKKFVITYVPVLN
jgi:hypothetical protein